MSTPMIVLIVVLVVLVAAAIGLYFLGKRLEKKRAEQDEQMAAVAQKKMKLKDAGLPAAVLEAMPKMMRRSKMPVVKAKVGPKVSTFLCDAAVFDDIPVKKEIKATVSGLYITGIKGLRKPLEQKEKKKKGFMARLREKAGK